MTKTSKIIRYAIVLVLLASMAFLLGVRPIVEKIPNVPKLGTLPAQLGEWRGKDLSIQPEVLEVLGPGDFLSRVYKRAANEPYVDLFIAYFPSQRAGDTIHSPKNCLPGSGWLPVESARIQLTNPNGMPVEVNRYIIAKGLDRQLVIYWYQAHNRIVASEYWAKYYLATDAMRLNRTDGALVRVITPLMPGEDVEAGQLRTMEFSKLLLPTLNNFVAP